MVMKTGWISSVGIDVVQNRVHSSVDSVHGRGFQRRMSRRRARNRGGACSRDDLGGGDACRTEQLDVVGMIWCGRRARRSGRWYGYGSGCGNWSR